MTSSGSFLGVHAIMEAAKKVQTDCEPLIASSAYGSIDSFHIEVIGSSLPHTGLGEDIIFTMKVDTVRPRVEKRLSQCEIDEMTKRVYHQVSQCFVQAIQGENSLCNEDQNLVKTA